MIKNGSFEKGWADIVVGYGNLKNQIPTDWEIFWTDIGDTGFFNNKTGEWSKINSIPEMIHKIDWQLPPDEQLGAEKALILDGSHVYKIFASNGIWQAGLRQTIKSLVPNKTVKITIPVQFHAHNVLNFDSNDFNVLIEANTMISHWTSDRNLLERVWNYIEVETESNDNGEIDLEVTMGTIWPNSRSAFIDNLTVEYVDEPESNETFEEHIVRISKSATKLNLNALAAIEKVILADGYTPYGNEKWATYDGIQYAIQGARLVGSEPPVRRVYYCQVPNWSNVKWIWQSEPENPPQPEDFTFTHWSTEYRYITQRFGNNPDYYSQFGLPAHEGVDIRAYTNSKIFSVADGIVSDLHLSPTGHNYGIFVRVLHKDNYETTYAHLDAITVSLGQKVKGGQQIGIADNTGNSSGSHLHLTLKKKGVTTTDEYGTWPYNIMNPEPFMLHFDGVYWPPKPTPKPPISGDLIDVGSFMIADPTAWRVVKHSSGSQEDIQDKSLGDGLYVRRKGSNGEWWAYDSNYAYLVHDTSPSPDSQGNERVYTLYKNGVVGSPKNPIKMKLGETWYETGQHYVQFRAKNGCRDLSENSGYAQNYCKLVRYEKNYTFNTYGQNLTLDEVIWLETSNGETQIYAKHQGKVIGWCGWISSWGSSEIVELHWDRGILINEPNRYCNF